MGINVGSLVRSWALRDPERTALIDRAGGGRVEVSYAALDLAARRAASSLTRRGIGCGDRVGLVGANSTAFLGAWLGAVYAGATILPIPILSAPPEVRFRLRHARCRAIVADEARLPLAAEAAGGLDVPAIDLAELSNEATAENAGPIDLPTDHVAMILYTSGTTGVPKGACITHASLFAHTSSLVEHAFRLTGDDRVLCVLPMTHSFGIRTAALAPLHAGAKVVVADRFDAARSLAWLEDEAITWLPAVPTMFAAWAAQTGSRDPGALRWCLSAGAPLPDEVAERAERRLGAFVYQGFGLTEATFSTVDTPPGPPTRSSVGRASFGVEVAIHDPDGAPLPTGEHGEIVVRGPNVMAGYLDDPAATGEALRDGWLHTGDVGRLDSAGRLFVVDRIKDLILHGGNNVYPSEVENALAAHEGVENVAVVGVPHDYYGEEVVAIVVARLGTAVDVAELDRHARAFLARFKTPTRYGFIEAMPVGPSAKVLRRELRALVLDGTIPTTPPPSQAGRAST